MATTSSSSSAPQGNKFDNLRASVHKFLHQKNAFTDVLEMIEKTVKLKREYLFYGSYRSHSHNSVLFRVLSRKREKGNVPLPPRNSVCPPFPTQLPNGH